MNILVVGGAGYIGSVTVDQLIDAGHDVTVLDSLVAGHRGALNAQAEFVQGDVRDEEALNRLFAAHTFSAVINYSGYIIAPESVRQPGRYFANNIGGAIALLNVMTTFGVMRHVFSSSAAVYGEPQMNPIPEEHPMSPINPYGETKAAVERLLPWYQKTFGLQSVSLRYFNAAGATARVGEDHRPETHLIPNVLQAAMGQRPAIALFGTDYPTRDGTCVRDYIHVTDLAAAHLLALGKTETGSAAYNLGSGRGFTNREVIDATHRVTGADVPVNEEPPRPGDPAELVASSDKIRADLGWEPQHPDIEDIIDSAWRWHTEHPKGYAS
jgi:UDP-glucose 4-epimerase